MKKITASVENVNVGTKLISKTNPEWGFFRVRDISNGIYEVSTDHGHTVIFDNELKYWDIIGR